MDFRTQGKTWILWVFLFSLSISDSFGEVGYQETPEDVGKNEIKHQNPVKACSLHPKDQEKGSLTSQESFRQ